MNLLASQFQVILCLGYLKLILSKRSESNLIFLSLVTMVERTSNVYTQVELPNWDIWEQYVSDLYFILNEQNIDRYISCSTYGKLCYGSFRWNMHSQQFTQLHL